MTSLIVDASVAVQWFLADEPGSARASRLRDDADAAGIELAAPDHFPLEVGQALVRGVRRGRLDPVELAGAVLALREFGLALRSSEDLLGDATGLAQVLGISVYDAAYLALAARIAAPIVTADRQMLHAAARVGLDALWLADFPG